MNYFILEGLVIAFLDIPTFQNNFIYAIMIFYYIIKINRSDIKTCLFIYFFLEQSNNSYSKFEIRRNIYISFISNLSSLFFKFSTQKTYLSVQRLVNFPRSNDRENKREEWTRRKMGVSFWGFESKDWNGLFREESNIRL